MDIAIIRPAALFSDLKVYIKCSFFNNRSRDWFIIKIRGWILIIKGVGDTDSSSYSENLGMDFHLKKVLGHSDFELEIE
jgi:hypothetical protein